MKFTVAILLLAAASHAAEQQYRARQKTRDTLNTEKRELEGNGNVDKRASALSTAPPSPTPGIVYADSKESQQDKSPAQQVYVTPLPQITKISDVLTGQGPPFPAAIASHLYSPISIYQPRLGAPTTYEISQPIPSQLAYSEHKIAYQSQPNAIQVATPAPQLKALPNYQPAYQQQILVQPQPLVHPQSLPQAQYLQQIPQNYQAPQFQIIRPVQYLQGPPAAYPAPPPPLYFRNQNQLPYLQAPQQLVPVQIPQPQQVVYAQYNDNQNQQIANKPQQNNQEQQQPQLQQIVVKEQEPQQQQQKPVVNIQGYSQPQGAVSFASFSQSQPQSTYQPKQQAQQLQQSRITLQFRGQPLNTQVKPDGDENLAASSSKSLRPISYFRPGATLQLQPVQQQVPQQQLLIPNPGYGAPTLNSASPTFPPVQYFGKHAQKIFARYSQQPQR